MWLFLFCFGAIFAGYAIYIGPLGNKRRNHRNCGYLLQNDSSYHLCSHQLDMFYVHGVTSLTNITLKSLTNISDEDLFSNNSCHHLDNLRDLVKNIAIQIWKDIPMDIDIEENLIKLFDTPWHQDLAYWPNTNITTDTRTLTFYFNLGNYSTPSYDKIYYIPNSGRIKKLRNHSYIPDNEPNSCTLHTSINLQNERVKFLEIPIGSIIIQNEYVVHRMEQNLSHNPTKLLVFILRPLKTIQQEREISFIPSIQHCLPRESNTLHYYQWQ